MKINKVVRHQVVPTNMQKNNLLLFVYGTLRRDCPTGAHKQYLQGAEFISSAKASGELFLIDYYPGFCLNKNSHSDKTKPWVVGEVYLLESDKQLQQLDRYEGCASDSPEPHEYTRTLIDVLLPNSETLTAWTYIYKNDTTRFTLISSGDFLKP